MRRLRTVQFEPRLLAEIIGGGFSDVLPDETVADLRIVDIRMNHWLDVIEVLCSSETFDEVPESMTPPLWKPSYRKVAVLA